MQWLLMLVGAVLGGMMEGWYGGAMMGGMVGLALGLSIRIQALAIKNESLEASVTDLHERFKRYADYVNQRLAQLDAANKSAAAPPATAPVVESIAVESPPFAVDPVAPEVPAGPPLEPIAARIEPPESTADRLTDAELAQFAIDSAQDAEGVEFVAEPVMPSRRWEAAEREMLRQSPEPRQPREPSGPSLLERGFSAAHAWLFGGNTVLRVGALLLFLGLAFLLRYAAERVVVPVELRYAGVALVAMVLLVIGWRLRFRNAAYGLMLQGTGVAVMYLTLFAAMRLHPLIPPAMALGLMVFVTAFAAMLAVLQDAQALAVAAALGGFAAPILTSTGSGNHVGLFSYFILLNAGILGISAFKAWRGLNLVGFVGTFGIGFAWGARSYQPELFASTEPFLIVFFLMYVGIGLLFARSTLMEADSQPRSEEREALLNWSARQANVVDGTTMFGPPIVGFGLQFALIQHIEFGAAFSALAVGLFYVLLARFLASRFPRQTLLLVETCLALGVIFGTLAIPLALDARWTSAAWAVEGAGILWLGVRQNRPIARAFALFLQVAAGIGFITTLGAGQATLLSGAWLGALMLGVSGLFTFRNLRQPDADAAHAWERACLPIIACVSLGFLYLIAPLLLDANGCVMAWALAGLATLWVGLRVQARSFLLSAFAIQLIGGAVFLLHLKAAAPDGSGVLAAGWQGLMVASILGFSLVAGMVLAVRDPHVRSDQGLMKGLSAVLLVGLIFLNLAVLFVLPWAKAALVWGASGLLILWLSLQLQQRASFLFGVFLELVAGVAFLTAVPILNIDLPAEGLKPLAHAGFWTPLVLALSAFVGAWRLHRETRLFPDAERTLSDEGLLKLSNLLLIWSIAWWLMSWISEAARFVPAEFRLHSLLLLGAATLAVWIVVARRSQWPALAVACTGAMPAGFLGLLASLAFDYHPAALLGWLAWPTFFGAHFWTLYRLEDVLPERVRSRTHVIGCLMLIVIASLELRFVFMALADVHNAWRWLGWALIPTAYLVLAGSAKPLRFWPVGPFAQEYRVSAAGPVAVVMLIWFWLATAASNGAADPLPYLPLVNPLELGLLFVLFGVYQWLGGRGREWTPVAALPDGFADFLAGISLFVMLSTAVFRGMHHYAEVPFELDAMLASMQVQAGLSILWSLIALGLMVMGHRRGGREAWVFGAVLVAVVVAKLFLVELGNHGGLARIVSFIGVGVLLLVVGYFAPIPPRHASSGSGKTVD